MDDSRVYLEKLSAFARILRMEGLPVTPQETADASRLLAQLGFEDRSLVKTALRTVFAKSRPEQLVFDKAFDGFFLSEEEIRRQAQEQAHQEQQIQQNLDEDELPETLSDEQRRSYGSMSQEERQKLQNFMEKYRDNAQRNPALYGDFIHSVFAKAILEQQMMKEDAAQGVEALDPEMGMLYRDISQFKDIEIPKAITLIQSIARQINGELAAKRRPGGHGSALDFRRTIRKGLESGGSFYRLRYRKKRTKKRNLVLLCDVSGSMIQFSEFALRFIQALDHASGNCRTFVFSEEIFEADAFALEDMDKFRAYIRSLGLYGRGTNLGGALEALLSQKPCPITPATTVLILSDTKTIDQPRAIAAIEKLRQNAGKVVWLNPIPQRKWRYIRSVQVMESLVPMASCSTLQELAAACRRLTQP